MGELSQLECMRIEHYYEWNSGKHSKDPRRHKSSVQTPRKLQYNNLSKLAKITHGLLLFCSRVLKAVVAYETSLGLEKIVDVEVTELSPGRCLFLLPFCPGFSSFFMAWEKGEK